MAAETPVATETPIAKYGLLFLMHTFHSLKPEKYCIFIASSLLFSPIASVPEVHRCSYKFIYRICNITREYAEYGSDIMHRLYINSYNLGRPKVISLSFGMQAQLE